MIKVHGEVVDTGTTWTEVVEFMRVGQIKATRRMI